MLATLAAAFVSRIPKPIRSFGVSVTNTSQPFQPGAISHDMLPTADDTYNIGSSSNRWQGIALACDAGPSQGVSIFLNQNDLEPIFVIVDSGSLAALQWGRGGNNFTDTYLQRDKSNVLDISGGNGSFDGGLSLDANTGSGAIGSIVGGGSTNLSVVDQHGSLILQGKKTTGLTIDGTNSLLTIGTGYQIKLNGGSTGAKTNTLGANGPNGTAGAPQTWIPIKLNNGTQGWIPVWT